jgi:hypothetical protein
VRKTLSRYGEFQIGMDLPAVAKQANRKPSEAKVIHQRPAVIQELQWQLDRFLRSLPQADPVQELRAFVTTRASAGE